MFALDRHLGHIFVDTMKLKPNELCHIDAFTDESETNASVLHRSIRLANALRRSGLVTGDVLAIGGRNHINLHIPYYAALMNGLPIVGVDLLYKLDELKGLFDISEPKIAFCDPGLYDSYKEAASQLGLKTRVVKFGAGPESLDEFLKEYDDDTPDNEFQVAEFDPDKVYAWLVSSSGTTGTPKVAAIKHLALIHKINGLMRIPMYFTAKIITPDAPKLPNKLALSASPLQWISGFFNPISMPILQQTKLQTSGPPTIEHFIQVINKYKPVTGMLGPSLISGVLNSKLPCDMTCFDFIVLIGAKIHDDVVLECKKRVRNDTVLVEAYGQTENLGPVFVINPMGPLGNCGRSVPGLNVKLVDPETQAEITESHVTGELWTKTVRFTEYYKNAEETERAFSADGWYKTGDLLYRDESHNYFFVERLKMLIKYRSYHIVPPEVEAVIRTHPGVLDVSVTSVPHEEDGEHAVACVVVRPGYDITAQEIKDLVAEKLSESKQLRGGVIFMKGLPMTSAGKVARAKLREQVVNLINNNKELIK